MKRRLAGTIAETRRRNHDRFGPAEGPERMADPPSALPATSTADLFAEMWRNDPEAREFVQAGRLGEMFGSGR